jgi:ATP-dependent DNA helicase RecQ
MQDILKKHFGYDTFRIGQEEIIREIISGRDALIIMPTGGGKSMCYQIPAMAMSGITVVISPLIALMKDQVEGLIENGISATFLNSTLTGSDYAKRMRDIESGAYKLIYVAPESLFTPPVMALADKMQIDQVAIDEAHCISQWGHDFRPSYQGIVEWIHRLKKRPIVTAFTATATQVVKKDILSLLALENPYVSISGVKRDNLIYRVVKPVKKIDYVRAWLDKVDASYTGIIYCATRKTVEKVAEKLSADGFNAVPYHAGLSSEKRSKTQEAFMQDKVRIVVATNAFGMGIDKPDVRFVIHYNMPQNMEAYYQEAGRAGRDGLESDCLLLYDASDIVKQRLLIAQGTNDETRYRMMLSNLNALVQYCHTGACLNAEIMRYFDEPVVEENCGNCGNCLDTTELVDYTLEAQKLISCVYRVGQRYGVNTVIDVLRGSKAEKILNWRLDKVSTYGIMKDKSVAEIKELTMFCIAEGYLFLTADTYPLLKLSGQSQSVLKGHQKVMMKPSKKYEEMKGSSASSKSKSRKKQGYTGQYQTLYTALADLRRHFAEEKSVPLYIICSNAVLEELAEKKPKTRHDFLDIKGLGEKKYELYGEAFLEVIANVQ